MCKSWWYFGSWSVLAVPISLCIVEVNFSNKQNKKVTMLKQFFTSILYNIPIYLPYLCIQVLFERVIWINGLLLNENTDIMSPVWELPLRLKTSNFVHSYCSAAYPTGFLKYFPSCNPVRPWITGSLFFLRACCGVCKYRYNYILNRNNPI